MKNINKIIIILLSILLMACTQLTKKEIETKNSNPQKALLVMDIQEDFTGENAKLPVDKVQAEMMIDNVNSLITYSENNDILVIYVKNVFPKKDFIANMVRHNAAVAGNEGVAFDRRLNVINENIFSKSKASVFSNSEFEKYLLDKNINELLITGVFAEQCVYWSSKAALKRGYEVTYIKDAVASKSQKKIEKAASKIERAGAKIKTTDQVIEESKK